MQIIHQPSPVNLANFLTTSSTVLFVSAGTNLIGVIIDRVTYRWTLGAINSFLQMSMQNAGLTEFCAPLLDDNGPTGPINVPGLAVFEQRVQFGPGVAINLGVTLGGTVRVSYNVQFRIL